MDKIYPLIEMSVTYVMNEFWTAIAKLIETIANLGAGAASNGMGYEPTVPEELVK